MVEIKRQSSEKFKQPGLGWMHSLACLNSNTMLIPQHSLVFLIGVENWPLGCLIFAYLTMCCKVFSTSTPTILLTLAGGGNGGGRVIHHGSF